MGKVSIKQRHFVRYTLKLLLEIILILIPVLPVINTIQKPPKKQSLLVQ